jgi:hypothetical protein
LRNPFVTGIITGGSALPEKSFSLVKVSHPDVVLWALKPAEEGSGVQPAAGGEDEADADHDNNDDSCGAHNG